MTAERSTDKEGVFGYLVDVCSIPAEGSFCTRVNGLEKKRIICNGLKETPDEAIANFEGEKKRTVIYSRTKAITIDGL